MANVLLRKSIVEDEKDCLPDAGVLLQEIDNCLSLIQNNADPMGEEVKFAAKIAVWAITNWLWILEKGTILRHLDYTHNGGLPV